MILINFSSFVHDNISLISYRYIVGFKRTFKQLFKPFEIVKASGVELISEDSSFGKSYGDWAAEYWKWWISIPENQSSINHPNKVTCLMHDTDAVIFLFSPTGNFHEQTCTIPSGKALLFTPYTMECDTGLTEYKNASTDALLACARDSDGGIFLGQDK